MKNPATRYPLFLFLALFAFSNSQAQTSLQLTPSNYNGYNISCFGSATGSINLTITGGTPPYTIIWSNAATTEDLSNVPAGYYRVSVDDADTLTNAIGAEITLTEPERLEMGEVHPYVYQNGYNVSAFGACNGSIILDVKGGVTPYTYFWKPGQQTTGNPTNLCSNENQVVVTDDNGCTIPYGIGLSQPQRDDWTMTGNSNSNPATEFIGTIDNKDISFRTNNEERLRIKSDGKISINTFSSAGSKIIYADSLGVLKSIPFLVPTCLPQTPFLPWQANPAIRDKVFACGIDFGIGTDSPREKLEVKGAVLITSWDNTLSNMTDYLQLKHDGVNARIESFGAGDLLLNNGNPRNVKVNLGVGSGYFETGNTTYLATEGGNVGIGNFNPAVKLDVSGYINATGDIKRNGISIFGGIWTVNNNGVDFSDNVGIGTNLPKEKLQVNDGYISTSIGSADGPGLNYGTAYMGFNAIKTGSQGWTSYTDQFHNGGTILFGSIGGDFSISTIPSCNPDCNTDQEYADLDVIDNVNFEIRAIDGHVAIGGSPHNDYRLSICGGLITKKIRVNSTNWCDFVFDMDYDLMSLQDIKKYIDENKHLPGIPSEKEICEEGIDVSQMLKLQMQKIEELTLHIIELENRIEKLNK